MMQIAIPEVIIGGAIVGLISWLLKNDRKNIYVSLSKVAASVEDLVHELQIERKERGLERERDLHRLSNLEASFSKLLGEHQAAIAAGGHAHRRGTDH